MDSDGKVYAYLCVYKYIRVHIWIISIFHFILSKHKLLFDDKLINSSYVADVVSCATLIGQKPPCFPPIKIARSMCHLPMAGCESPHVKLAHHGWLIPAELRRSAAVVIFSQLA